MNVNEREFQATLPSNASMQIFPGNKATNYSTRLDRAYSLKSDWEVALMEIMYQCSWRTMQTGTIIGFVIVPEVPYSKDDIPKGVPSELPLVNAYYNNMIKALTKRTEHTSTEYYTTQDDGENVYVRVHPVPDKYFKGVKEVCEWICECFNDDVKPLNLKIKGWYSFYDSTKKLEFFFEQCKKVEMWTNNKEFLKMLGYKDLNKIHTTVRIANDDGEYDRRPMKNFIRGRPFISDTSVNVPTIDALYVYSDIVDPQIVGDTKAPLLGVAPVSYEADQMKYWQFNPPYYIPLAKTSFDTIEILICNDKGEKIEFASSSKVICRLHFRLRQSPF